MTDAAMTVVTANGVGPGLAKASPSTRFAQEQVDLILATCCGGASRSEADALISIAEARGLNPILGECYFVKRYDSKAKAEKWSVQASIDSFRIKAEQTGLYAGQDEPEFEYDGDGNPVVARVRVYRKDWTRPMVGVARWDEYVQTTREGQPTKFWKDMPHNQLAKCAEALAMRKAFPVVLAGLYTTEEMQQADNESPPARRATQITGQTARAQLPEAASDPDVLTDIHRMIDEAEEKRALNKVAAATKKAKADGKINEGDYKLIVKATEMKARLLADHPSSPRAADDGPSHEREPGEEG